MLKYFFALGFCAVALMCNAQIIFQKTYGGGTLFENGFYVKETTDGGYIVTGLTDSSLSGSIDVYLIKTNSVGDTLWTKTYGGVGNEGGVCVQQTSEGGYIILGNSNSFGAGESGTYLIKTDSIGSLLWSKFFTAGATAPLVGGQFIRQTNDGGYIILAEQADSSDVIKTDTAGNIIWAKSFAGRLNQAGSNAIQQTSDGGYIIIASRGSTAVEDMYLLKTDGNGNALWSKSYGGSNDDWGYAVQQTSDGGYIAAGTFNVNDVYLVKTDSSGNIIWSKTYDGGGQDIARGVLQISDGGYIIVANTTGFIANGGIYLLRTDANGNLFWSRFIRVTGPTFQRGNAVYSTTDGGYIISGFLSPSFPTGNSIFLIKTDSIGSSCNDTAVTLITNIPNTIVTNLSGLGSVRNLTVSSPATITGGGCAVTSYCTTVGIAGMTDPGLQISIYPNPATTEIRIQNTKWKIEKIEVYDLLGKLQPLKYESATIDVSGLNQGMYFAKVKGEKEERLLKFIKQ